LLKYILLQSRLSQTGFFVANATIKKRNKREQFMKKLVVSIVVLTFVIGFIGITDVSAVDFGDDITVMDNAGKLNSWYSRDKEDREVEIGNLTSQEWDLEGFFLDGTQLTMVGGYDFLNGYDDTYSGDIFLDVDGDMKYGDDADGLTDGMTWGDLGNISIDNVFGYDYVLDLNFDPDSNTQTYDVYQIDENAKLISPYFRRNDSSGAYEYKSGGTLLTSGTIDYVAGLSDAETGFEGGSHNAATVDLGFITDATDFTAHFTLSCGNDDLIGKGHLGGTTPPVATPEPGTLLLLGGGLLALVGLNRKRNA
jgi:hypothetical protein